MQVDVLHNRVLFVRNLPFKLKPDELYELFGRFGSIRQIRRGTSSSTRGSAFVVFSELSDARKAVDQLSGFHFGGRYLVCGFYNKKREDIKSDIKPEP